MFKLLSIVLLSFTLLKYSCNLSRNQVPTVQSISLNDKDTGFAVVELFTSEGCSSCPPADKLATEIVNQAEKKQQKIIVLSEHVDYWNNIGWKDPFSNATFSERQKWYAAFSEEGGIYTPQMVVNGSIFFVGSDSEKAASAINASLAATGTTKDIQIEKNNTHPEMIAYKIPPPADDEMLTVFWVQKSATSKVLRGENRGKTLYHRNVVREIIIIEKPPVSGNIKFKNTATINYDQYSVIGFLQNKKNGIIRSIGIAK